MILRLLVALLLIAGSSAGQVIVKGSATVGGKTAASSAVVSTDNGSWLPGYNGGSPISGWYQLTNTAFRGSTPDVKVPTNYSSCSGCNWDLTADVMTDWGGGAYDTSRHRMMIFGGGHLGYGGNEVYALDLAANGGSTAPRGVYRLTNPCPTWTQNNDPICTNKPNSRHTYFGLVYSVARDAFVIFDGGMYGSAVNTGNIVWSLDLSTLPALNETTHVPNDTTAKPSTETWSQRGSITNVSGQDVNGIADPGATMVARSGHFYMGNQHTVIDYNDTTGAFVGSTLTDTMNGTSYYAIWVYNSRTPNLIWHVGKGEFEKLDVTTGVHTAVSPASVTGCTFSTVTNAAGPSVAYDTNRNILVFWLGGGVVYEWTPAASGGTCVARSFTNSFGCATWDSNMIYGRWAYDPTYNVFVAWSNATANACIWRP